jgi:hypothetical protein
MIPFPLRWQLPRAPVTEDDRLYTQAFHCLAAASWRFAAARSRLLDAPGSGSFVAALSDYECARMASGNHEGRRRSDRQRPGRKAMHAVGCLSEG